MNVLADKSDIEYSVLGVRLDLDVTGLAGVRGAGCWPSKAELAERLRLRSDALTGRLPACFHAQFLLASRYRTVLPLALDRLPAVLAAAIRRTAAREISVVNRARRVIG